MNENRSPGTPDVASGLKFILGSVPVAPVVASVQSWLIVSGLNWNTITLGLAVMSVAAPMAEKEISAPLRTAPTMPLPSYAPRQGAQDLLDDLPRHGLGPAAGRRAEGDVEVWQVARLGQRAGGGQTGGDKLANCRPSAAEPPGRLRMRRSIRMGAACISFVRGRRRRSRGSAARGPGPDACAGVWAANRGRPAGGGAACGGAGGATTRTSSVPICTRPPDRTGRIWLAAAVPAPAA